MKILTSILFLILFISSTNAQYPFERFDSIKYKSYDNWTNNKWLEENNTIHNTLTIKDFFKTKDSLTIQLSTFKEKWDSSYISIFTNGTLKQKIFEPMSFLGYNFWNSLIVEDINGDGLNDIKLNVSYMSNGLGMLSRIIYLFQTKDKKFIKISFDDNLGNGNRVERDFDKDGDFEIITMTLNGFQSHNYWTFDLFNYENGILKNVDDKFDYPIMIQFLHRTNYKITDKISKEKMKCFKLEMPEAIDIK
jgi:hypothetical protein